MQGCLFSNLVGVAEAGPAFPGQAWFAIPTIDPNYQTFASLLLTAKASDRPINVTADGTNSCGFATARMLSF